MCCDDRSPLSIDLWNILLSHSLIPSTLSASYNFTISANIDSSMLSDSLFAHELGSVIHFLAVITRRDLIKAIIYCSSAVTDRSMLLFDQQHVCSGYVGYIVIFSYDSSVIFFGSAIFKSFT